VPVVGAMRGVEVVGGMPEFDGRTKRARAANKWCRLTAES
jgi:hypothetical protein